MARRKPKNHPFLHDESVEAELLEGEPETAAEEGAETARASRAEQVLERKGVRDRLVEVWNDANAGYIEQSTRTNEQQDNWDIFNCRRSAYQVYNGNAQIFAPIVRDAIMARSQRFTNQIFPQSGRTVEAIDANGEIPSGYVAMMEYYTRKSSLRDLVIPPMLRAGDIEGQYNLYVSWSDARSTAVKRTKAAIKVDIAGVETEVADDEATDDREEFEIEVAYPRFEVLSDADVMVVPVTAATIAEAIYLHKGSVTVLRRWTKGMVELAEDEGWIDKDAAALLMSAMADTATNQNSELLRKHLDGAGVEKGGQTAQVYETWTLVEVDGKEQLCRAFFGGGELILGCTLSPYWRPLPPIISAPVEKDPQMFKGNAPVSKVAGLQYAANDLLNEGLDSATMAILPVILTDPEKNPRTSSMVLDLAAVWETSPNDTKFAEFPPLYQHAMTMLSQLQNMIFQTLSVNAAMIPQQKSVGGNRDLSQAEVAQEQQVDILATSEVVSGLQAGVLDEILQWIMWLDHQYRDDDLVVRAFGPAGLRASMETVPPLQLGNALSFRWFGVEAARNMAMIQQQVAAINVIRGIPPSLYQGYTLDLAPFITHMLANVFSPALAPLVFKSVKDQLSVRADLENKLLDLGYDLQTHPMDDDQEHLAAHAQDMAEGGDPHGNKRTHIQLHQAQMQQKNMMMAQQAQMALMGPMQGGAPGAPGGPGLPGVPGGPPGAAGTAGTPRIGATPTGARPAQYAPPGAVHQDRMPGAGAIVMPRAAR